LAADASTTEKW